MKGSLFLLVFCLLTSPALPSEAVLSGNVTKPVLLTLTARTPGRVIDPPNVGDRFTPRSLTGAKPVVTIETEERSQIAALAATLDRIRSLLHHNGYYYEELEGRYGLEQDDLRVISLEEAADLYFAYNKGKASDIYQGGSGIENYGGQNAPDATVAQIAKSQPWSDALAWMRRARPSDWTSDKESMLVINKSARRNFRRELGIDDMRIETLDGRVPLRMNSQVLLQGPPLESRKIKLRLPFENTFEQCDKVLRYWSEVEKYSVWTDEDLSFLAEVDKSGAVSQISTRFMDDYPKDQMVSKISDALNADCEKLKRNLRWRGAYQTVVRVAANKTIAARRNAHNMGVAAASQGFVDEIVNDITHGTSIIEKSLAMSPRDIEEAYRHLGERQVRDIVSAVVVHATQIPNEGIGPSAQEELLLTTLKSIAPPLSFIGDILIISEDQPRITAKQSLSPIQSWRSRITEDRTQLNQELEIERTRTAFAKARIAIGLHDTTQQIEGGLLSRLLDEELLVIEERWAKRLMGTWNETRSALNRAVRTYDEGRHWASEPIEVVAVLANDVQSVDAGQPVLVARATQRISTSLPAKDVHGLLPIVTVGSRFNASLENVAALMPPIQFRQKILDLPAASSIVSEVEQLRQRVLLDVPATGVVTDINDNHITIEFSMTPNGYVIDPANLNPSVPDMPAERLRRLLELIGLSPEPNEKYRLTTLELDTGASIMVKLTPAASAVQAASTLRQWETLATSGVR